MAHHKSAKKRIRQSRARRLYNRYHLKTTKTFIKKFKLVTEKDKALQQLSQLYSKIDKLVKRGIFHKNKAANLKSKLTKKAMNLP